MNRFHLLHATEFIYDGPVYESYNEVRLRPIHDDRQSCLSFRLITPPAALLTKTATGTGFMSPAFFRITAACESKPNP
jgi:hypothetical protein